MESWFQLWFALGIFDSWVQSALVPISLYILISGLDDLVVAVVALASRRKSARIPNAEFTKEEERLIAILLPLWKEADVVTGMVEHNLAAIDYTNYVIFAGVYPNDPETVRAVRALAVRFPRVQVTVCPHGGPTSKADCLNWIYRGIQEYESRHNVRFEVLVTHDAEDLIHPQSLRILNHYTARYDMVQIPVLPLATPWNDLTHGVYCDEFAEYQLKDAIARQTMGAFLPSNGVGTGYRRDALDRLAAQSGGCIFNPECLTEDYENGLRLHQLGCSQLFVPVAFGNGAPVATREYFPRTFRQAVRQRKRWITGNALQAWRRHGWGRGVVQRYWLWRDRKGLIGNPVSALTNLISLYGFLSLLWSLFSGRPWMLFQVDFGPLLLAAFALQSVSLSARIYCVYRIYGLACAVGTPARAVWANLINSVATVAAIWRFAHSCLTGQPLAWTKTAHVYPSPAILASHKRSIEDVLVSEGYISAEELEKARGSLAEESSLAAHLIETGKLNEEDYYEALSIQQNIPLTRVLPSQVSRRIARSLPARVAREFRLLPIQVTEGRLWVGGPAIPDERTLAALRRFTRLEIRFGLLTQSNFEELAKELL